MPEKTVTLHRGLTDIHTTNFTALLDMLQIRKFWRLVATGRYAVEQWSCVVVSDRECPLRSHQRRRCAVRTQKMELREPLLYKYSRKFFYQTTFLVDS